MIVAENGEEASHGNHVVCSSPDSTVKTEEIPQDLQFPEVFSAEELSHCNLEDLSNIIGTVITPVESREAPATSEPSEMIEYLTMQPLQNMSSQISPTNPEPMWSINNVSPKSDSSPPMWQNGILKSCESADSTQWTPSNLNGTSSKTLSQTNHLKDIISGSSSIYQKKNPENLVAALLKQPVNGSNSTYQTLHKLDMNDNGGGMYGTPASETNGHHPVFNSMSHSVTSTTTEMNPTKLLSSPHMIATISSSNNSLIPPDPIPNGYSHSKPQKSPKIRSRPPTTMKKEGRLHPCAICNKSFKDRFSLEAHYRIHTGERPFRCPTCQKGFKQKAHMQKHSTMHSTNPRERMGQVPINRDRNKKTYNRDNRKKIMDKVGVKKPDSTDKNGGFYPYPDSYSESSVSTTADMFDLSPIKVEVADNQINNYGELYRRLTLPNSFPIHSQMNGGVHPKTPNVSPPISSNGSNSYSPIKVDGVNSNDSFPSIKSEPGSSEGDYYGMGPETVTPMQATSTTEECGVTEGVAATSPSRNVSDNDDSIVKININNIAIEFIRRKLELSYSCSLCNKPVTRVCMPEHAQEHVYAMHAEQEHIRTAHLAIQPPALQQLEPAAVNNSKMVDDMFDDGKTLPCLMCNEMIPQDEYVEHFNSHDEHLTPAS